MGKKKWRFEMKFLCVECDEAMQLKETKDPVDGSIAVVFRCPSCRREIAMLTNPMETQVVGSLGVSIGPKPQPSVPMEGIRKSLAEKKDDEDSVNSGSKCPFTDVVADALSKQDSTEIIWTKEAEERLARIPSFIRPMAKKGIEQYANENGFPQIDNKVMDAVKDMYGM
jgi:hypothetical protein